MKINYIIGLTGLFFTILWTSCYEDLGNYNYDWVPEVHIRQMKDTAVDRGGVLSLEPSLYKVLNRDTNVHHDINPDDYTYRWFDNNGKVLSTKQNLNDTIWLSTGKYQITYEVKDKNTDLNWTTMFSLAVSGRIAGALVFLTEDEERRVELDVYARNAKGEKFLEKGTLARSGFPHTGGGANCVYYGLYAAKKNCLWIATGEGTGWVDLVNFQWNPTNLARSLMLQPKPVSYTFKNIVLIGANLHFFMTEAGEVHVMGPQMVMWTNLAFLDGQQFAACPVIGGDSFGAVLYDKTNRRFVSYNCIKVASGAEASCFALPDEDALNGVELIHMQALKNNKILAVVKDESGKYWKYSWSIQIGSTGKYGGKINIAETEELKNIGMIENAEHIVLDRLNGFIYFSIGNKLYNYRSGGGVDGCEEVRGFSSNDPICSIISQQFSKADHYNEGIFVATWNKAGGNSGGNVYLLKPSTQESRDVSILESISGLGQVKSISYW